MMHDTIASALSNILNAEKIGKDFCIIKPFSKMIKEVLTIMNSQGYVGSSEIIEDGKGKRIKLNLLGKINKCGAIKPRFSVNKDSFEKFEKRYLPSHRGKYDYIIFSKGEDNERDTGDDVVIVNKALSKILQHKRIMEARQSDSDRKRKKSSPQGEVMDLEEMMKQKRKSTGDSF